MLSVVPYHHPGITLAITSTDVELVTATADNPSNHSQDKPSVSDSAELNMLPSNLTNDITSLSI